MPASDPPVRDFAGEAPARPRPRVWLLLVTVLVIGTAGIVYELVAGTIASYLLGDSVTQFSLVIGLYLSALGLGSYVSRFVPDNRLAATFVEVELATALAGGCSAPALFLAFGHTRAFAVVLYGFVVVVGTLVGLELPLLVRLLREHVGLRDLLARALTFDYVGALLGSVLFSLVVVPRLGLVRTSLVFGVVNASAAFFSTWLLGPSAPRVGRLRARAVLVVALLVVGLTQSVRLTRMGEEEVYGDPVIFADQTPYQRIVATRSRASWQLFLNGGLQFSSADEYRYHEALVHPAFAAAARRDRVLIVGGGDGLAAREVLRYPDVSHVTLVDLDPEMTDIARTFRPLRELNEAALDDPRMTLIHEDAMPWLARPEAGAFDVIVVDFPDPNSFAVGKLYSQRFYASVRDHLAPGGAVVVQATSPLMSRTSFWCIVRTMRAAELTVRPYHTSLPSFGEWGFALAQRGDFAVPAHVRLGGLRFLDDATMASLFVFGVDMGEVDADVNTLDTQVLVQYQERDWRRWD
jgi:spermidine synthase